LAKYAHQKGFGAVVQHQRRILRLLLLTLFLLVISTSITGALRCGGANQLKTL